MSKTVRIKIQTAHIPSSKFTWDNKECIGCTEASDLNGYLGSRLPRLPDQITVHSGRTGKRQTFIFHDVDVVAENKVFVYKTYLVPDGLCPEEGYYYSLHILND